ncbi:MAG: saccharopine dehydrogenase [Sandaracinaceae bacterium]|nr:MAG: saccharopine dehydrogenase [Sandaracinaceae bacterium]
MSPAMTDRPFDIVLWGATGFTGRLVAEYLVKHHLDDGLKLALAGRNEKKLEEIRAGLGPKAKDLPLLLGDSFDEEALSSIAQRATVVCTTVGPYAKYGEALVDACVRHGTHYCDLTGETQFIRRMVDRHHEAAKRSGARIVHCCGFDSIPSDLGTWMMQEEMHRRHGVYAKEVRFYAGESKGGFSGGTLASMLNLMEEIRRDPSLRKVVGHPYALNPEGEREGPDGSDPMGVEKDPYVDQWTGPFVMAAINTRVVRRSHALRGYPWGKGFRYSERMTFGSGAKGSVAAAAVAGGMAAFLGAASVEVGRKVLSRLLPPGEGPDAKAREEGFFKIRFVAIADTDAGEVELRGLVVGQNDPGYGETSKMLGEAAVCLAKDPLDSEPGVTTPSVAMGPHLIERLRAAGMTFEVKD